MISKKICFLAKKGGAGQTTATSLTAKSLARLGKRVLAVDLNSGTDLSDAFKITEEYLFNLSDVLDEEEPLNAVKSVCKNIDYIGAVQRDIPFETLNTERFEELFSKYDFVLFDLPKGAVFPYSEQINIFISPPKKRELERLYAYSDSFIDCENRLLVSGISKKEVSQGLSENLDDCVDISGLRLIAAVPFDLNFSRGSALPNENVLIAYSNLSKRLLGENIGLNPKIL